MLSAQTLSLARLMRRAALEELLPRHGRLRANEIHSHSDGSLFTAADIANEKRLVEGTKIIYPHARAAGEEEISEDPHAFLKDALHQDVIIIDPIDGTGAFKRGEDTYGVMAACISQGVTIAGAIYTPGHAVRNQDGTFSPGKDLMILAEKGKGCFVNGVKATLTGRPSSLTEKARIAFACRNQDKEAEDILAAGVPGYMTRHNSSHDYTRILIGESDATFYSEGFMPLTGQGKCPPWDHAAGVLAIQEAGGYAALPYGRDEGQAYNPLLCHDRLLVCANERLFRDVMQHIRARAPHLTAPRIPPSPAMQ